MARARLTPTGEDDRVDEPPKNISVGAVAAHVLAEQALAERHADCLSAAEREAVRELLGFLEILRQMVADERFQKEAGARIGRWRDTGKAWLLAIGAAVGLVASVIAAIKSY